MDEARFQMLMLTARLISGDYGLGYQHGLRERYHGSSFGDTDPGAEAAWTWLDRSTLLGVGYLDGQAGLEPKLFTSRDI